MKVERRKFARFLSLPGQERRLFLEALVLQIWVGLLLKVVPFRWIPLLFGNKVKSQKSKVKSFENPKPGTWNPSGGGHSLEPGTLNLIKTAIQRSGPYSPWRNKCLVQSLTARQMLKRRNIGSQLSLGAVKDRSMKLTAHAWIKAGDFEIVQMGGEYQELYYF